MIPHFDSNHAYLGSIEKTESEEIQKIFPLYKKHSPLIFIQNLDTPYDLKFLDTKVFRAAPKFDNNEIYLAWLNTLEKKKGNFWKELGIFDFIQLSRQGPTCYQDMLLAALHFWDISTNSLHLKCGMLTPTLLDVAAITGLKPTGDIFDQDICESDITFDFKRADADHYNTKNEDVSDAEHIAFLTLWLSMYVFCTRSIQVAKHYRTLAYQLLEGKQICLSKLLLGCLYESQPRSD